MQKPATVFDENATASNRPVGRILGAFSGAVFFAIMLGAIWAMAFATFIPTKLTAMLSIGVAGGIGLFGGLLAIKYRRLPLSVNQTSPRPYNPFIDQPPVPRFILSFLVWSLATFATCDVTAAEMFTISAGKLGAGTAVVSGWSSHGRGQCAHFNVKELGIMFHSPFCASYRDAQVVPKGATIQLEGPVSPFGIEVRHWAIQSTSS